METDRRKFLGLMAAAPLTAKEVAEQAAAGVGVSSESTPGAPAGEIGLPGGIRENGFNPITGQFSPWRKAEIRKHASIVQSLDPDIASLRSASLSGKVGMQRRRQISQAEDEARFHIWLFSERINEAESK